MKRNRFFAVLAVAGMFALGACSATAAASVPTEPAPTTLPVDTSATASAEPTPAACPTAYVQTVTPNPVLNRFIEGGLKGLPGDLNKEVLDALGHSHLYMVAIGDTMFKTSINDKTLIDATGTCLSDTGQALMTKFEGAFAMLTASDTTASTGYNTGISNGQVVVDTSGVINGNTRAVKFVDQNGNVVLVLLRRCGNVVLPSPGTYPHGTTDNAKDPKDNVGAPQGTTQLGTGPITKTNQSVAQKAAGQTAGNVTDKTVAANTGAGTTTTDLGSSGSGTTITAPGASPGGDSVATATNGGAQVSNDPGGTSGVTVIVDPDANP